MPHDIEIVSGGEENDTPVDHTSDLLIGFTDESGHPEPMEDESDDVEVIMDEEDNDEDEDMEDDDEEEEHPEDEGDENQLPAADETMSGDQEEEEEDDGQFEPEYSDDVNQHEEEDETEDEDELVEPEIIGEEPSSAQEEETHDDDVVIDDNEDEDEDEDEQENQEGSITFVVPMEPVVMEEDEDTDDDDEQQEMEEAMDSLPMMMMPQMMMMNDMQDAPPAMQMVSEFFDDIFSSVFSRMESSFADEDSAQVVTRIHISTSPDDVLESGMEPFDVVEHIRESMADFVEAAREQSMMMSPSDNDEPIHRYCSLQRECADEIDRLCAIERTSNVASAIPHCLVEHQEELGENCRAALEQRFNDHEEDDSETATSDNMEEPVPVVPATPTAPVESDKPEPACAEDARRYCSDSQRLRDEKGALGVVACLNRMKASLSPKCLESVQHKPVFMCASDLINQCANVRGRANMLRCLFAQQTLSDECSAALRRPLNSNNDFAVPHVAGNFKTASVHDRVVATIHHVSSKIPVVPLAIGLSMFVLLLVAAVIRYRRRRAAQASKRVVQLLVPSQEEKSSQVQMV